MTMTITESRQSLGIIDPLDTFLDKDRSHIERFGIAMAVGVSHLYLDELIAGCHSPNPQTVLLSRMNLHLTLNGGGKKVKRDLIQAVADSLDQNDGDIFATALRNLSK
jgi:hypothetical protein